MRPLDAVRQFLEREQIQNQAVVCALSGGADSVCLLYCLLKWQKKYQLRISAIHIQHNLRGAESIRDERFCADLCQKFHVSLKIVSVDVQTYQQEHSGCSVETAARECRYQAFCEHAEGLVATAHNASDNLETVIFRLARGTGLKGLCGIPQKRDIYIRPLLKSSRQEIEHFLSEQHLDYITDSSNQQDIYTRNFIRHHITPLLSGICPGSTEKSISMMTDILTEEENFLAFSAKTAYAEHLLPDGTLKDLQNLHPAVQRRCIRIFLESHQVSSNYLNVLTVQKLLQHGGQAEIIRGELTVHVSHHVLFLERKLPDVLPKPLIIGENQIFPGYLVTAELVQKKNFSEFEKIHRIFANSALDYDIIKESAVLHGRTNGLYLKPDGKNHTVSVKKWLQTQPVSLRNSLHCLSDASGLVWVQNLGVSCRACVTEHTQNMLILHVHTANTECTSDYHISDVY
ncbi:MAG: tRNA lysidine(34) synthetase TilS [Ruminococcus sp.]|nr:tRNA lysidine(34) synthetase TilS [Ruminococcus sp.]